jgi:hypothetical protein
VHRLELLFHAAHVLLRSEDVTPPKSALANPVQSLVIHLVEANL